MAKKFEIIVSAEAEKNIEEAFRWIASDNESAARKWYGGLIEALQSLSESPLRCPVAPESTLGLIDREVRQMLYGRGYWKYRVLYVVEEPKVMVLHVRHGARLYLGQESPEDGEPS
jgi:plasmid stabilization system protein ParE